MTSDLIVQATGTEEIMPLKYLLLEPQDSIINKPNLRQTVRETSSCYQQNSRPPYLVVFTHSSPANFQLRQKVRETWYNQKQRVRNRIVNFFILGMPSGSQAAAVQKQIVAESHQHRDIVQFNFVDSYRNLTLKHTTALKFLSEACRNVTYAFAMKADDDMVIDVDTIVFYMKQLTLNRSAPPSRSLYCTHMVYKEVVKRQKDFKWAITPEEYPGRHYPPYCYGGTYLMTPDLIPDLYN
ncbi:UDP-GalNAc:beta-1,3-N-acetylgalactosaminyltransferase 1-like, partial [Paramacrobiotus metropolitanus]|uniref:UDP-GalNAc:beta-1, 3-N-acetylgalactosaminyltransferase 1-like n=1 Tax=Paramacrobiotus metropolitanus TaxID=2943436 RepID=UPI0024465B08